MDYNDKTVTIHYNLQNTTENIELIKKDIIKENLQECNFYIYNNAAYMKSIDIDLTQFNEFPNIFQIGNSFNSIISIIPIQVKVYTTSYINTFKNSKLNNVILDLRSISNTDPPIKKYVPEIIASLIHKNIKHIEILHDLTQSIYTNIFYDSLITKFNKRL